MSTPERAGAAWCAPASCSAAPRPKRRIWPSSFSGLVTRVLRSLDVDHMWRSGHVKPNAGLGVAFVACIVLSAAAAILAGRGMKARRAGWARPAGMSVLLGLAAIGVQCVEFTVQKFGPTDGAFASIFCTWLALYMIAVLATMYWLETQVATELRASKEPASSTTAELTTLATACRSALRNNG